MLPRRTRDAAALAAFLPYVEAVALDEARRSTRADLKRRGVMIGANDLFIAAHARSLCLTLVTKNTDEFERVGDLEIENRTICRHAASVEVAGGAPRRCG